MQIFLHLRRHLAIEGIAEKRTGKRTLFFTDSVDKSGNLQYDTRIYCVFCEI